jgi:hypothetical protein
MLSLPTAIQIEEKRGWHLSPTAGKNVFREELRYRNHAISLLG